MSNFVSGGEILGSDLYKRVQLEVRLKALKARNSKAQGASPGVTMEQWIKPCKGETGRCAALTGLNGKSIPNPGFRLLRSLHPGLCCLALSALEIISCS
jgi:hypothetical protein